MARWMRYSLILGLVAVILLIAREIPSASQCKTTTLKFNNCVIKVETVDTPALRQRGLSGRKKMAEDAGMLFIFERAEYHSFWMKDMHFPLDLIWIFNGEVVDIKANVPPPAGPVLELVRYRPAVPANYVLEVNAGVAEKCGLKVGDKIEL